MKNILFLGDYFPHFSFDTLRNHKIIESLHNEGFGIYYLSNSWCDVDEHSFVDPYMHRKTGFIKECYFVDPVGLRGLNTMVALTALAKSIVTQNNIDYIFVSDVKKYGMAAEVINAHFGIPIVASLWSDVSFYHLYESYTKIWFDSFVNKIKYLYTHTCRKSIYAKFSDRTSVLPMLPYNYEKVSQEEYKDCVIVIGRPNRETKIDYLSKRIVNLSHNRDIKVLIWGEYRNAIHQNLLNTKSKKIEYIDYKDGINIFKELSGAMVVNTETLANSADRIYDRHSSIDKELLLRSYNLFPLISTDSKTCDILNHYYTPALEKHSDSSCKLLTISNDETIGKHFRKEVLGV